MTESVPATGKDARPRRGLPSWVQRTLAGLAAVSAVVLAVLAILPLFIDGESFRKPLQQALSKATGREVLLGRVELSTLGNIGLKTDQVRVVNSEGVAELQARSAFVELEVLPLVARRLEVRSIELDGAEIELKRFRDGRWSFDSLLTNRAGSEAGVNIAGTALKVLDGTVRINDEAVQPPQQFVVSGLSLNLSKIDRKDQPVSLQGTVTNSIREKPVATVLTIDGRFSLGDGGDWRELSGDVNILAQKFRPRYLAAYTRDIPALAGLTGVFDLNFNWKGRLGGESNLKGTMGTRLLRWDWPAVFTKEPWLVRKVRVETAMKIAGDQIQAESLRLTGDNLDATIKGSLVRAAGPGAPPPLIDITLKSGFIDPYLLRANVPIALVPEQARGWISESKGSGVLRTDLVVRGPFDRLMAQGTFEFRNFKIANPRLRGAIEAMNGKLALLETTYKLDNLRIGRPGADATFNGTINRTPDGQVNLLATAASAELAPFSNLGRGRFGTLGGRGRLDLAITGTLDAPQLEGKAELLGASLQRDGWTQPLRDIRGDVTFAPDKITLAGLTAQLGDSDVSVEGTLAGYGTGSPNPQLAITSGSLDLKAAYSLLGSDVFEGSFRRVFRSTFRSLAGIAAVDLKVQGSVTTGKINLRGARVGLAALTTPLEDTVGTVSLNERGTSIDGVRTVVAGSPFTLKGFLGRGGDSQISGDGSLSFPAAAALLTPGSKNGIRARGTAPVSFTVSGAESARSFTATADLSNVSELTLGNALDLAPAERLILAGTLTPRALVLGGTSRLDLSELSLAVGGSVSNLGRASQSYNLRLRSDGPVEFSALGRYIAPLAGLGISGGSPSPLDVQVVGEAPTVQAELQLSGVNLPGVLGGITDLDGPINLVGNRVSSSGVSFKIDGIPGRVSGSLTNPRDPTLNFDLRLERFNIDTLIAAAAAGARDLRALRGSGSVRIEGGTLSRMNFSGLRSNVRFESGGLWTLTGLDVAIAGGQMGGSLVADLRSGSPRYSGNVSMRGVDSNQIAITYLGFGNQVAGPADLQMSFSAQGANPESFLTSLTGSGSMSINSGRLWTADLLGPLFGNLAGGVGGAVRGLNTGRFERLGGSFQVDRGTANLQNFSYSTSGLLLQVSGTLNLSDRRAALQAEGEIARLGSNLAGLVRRAAGETAAGFAFDITGPLTQPGSIQNLRWLQSPTPGENTGSTPGEATSAPQ